MNTGMKKILLTGWYGVHNTGDEAILSALLFRLNESGYENISVLSYNPKHTAAIHRVNAIPELRLGFTQAVKAISQAEVLILGGGGLLKDEGKSYLYLLIKCWLAKITGTKIILSGIGVGPLYTSFGVWITRQIANLADIITTRDIESQQLLTSIGITKEIHVTGDLALGIKPPGIDLGKKILSDMGIKKLPGRSLIGLSLRPWYHLPRFWPDGSNLYNEFLEKFIEAYKDLANWIDADILFVPMQYEQDVGISNKLKTRLSNRGFNDALCHQKLNFLETTSVINNLDFVIGMRLHALILASIYTKPFFAISYSNKVSSFVRQINNNWYQDIDDFENESFVSGLRNIIIDRVNASDQVKHQTSLLQAASLKNYEYITNQIEGENV